MTISDSAKLIFEIKIFPHHLNLFNFYLIYFYAQGMSSPEKPPTTAYEPSIKILWKM